MYTCYPYTFVLWITSIQRTTLRSISENYDYDVREFAYDIYNARNQTRDLVPDLDPYIIEAVKEDKSSVKLSELIVSKYN